MVSFDLDAALADTLALGASDLHLKVPTSPRVRVDGELQPLDGYPPLSAEDTAEIKQRLLSSDTKREHFERYGSADLSYYTDQGRFRVAAFSQRGSASFVFRAIPAAPDPDALGLPEVVHSWADAMRGLVVVTGPTGAGKSTTQAALVDLINRRRTCHILTIEDPIEYLHSDRRAVVCQREIGLDAPTYHVALRAALRQDPDVILIGEVRDEETAMTALRAAETGHLVLCTMHTTNAPETVQRFIDLFGERSASLARQVLASTLVGVCSQRLLPAQRGGRLLNAEILVNSARVREMISTEQSIKDLHTAIVEGDYYGMRTFDQCLLAHVRDGSVSMTDALTYATDPHDFKLALQTTAPPTPVEPVEPVEG
jgi:twitching motility protein PilT